MENSLYILIPLSILLVFAIGAVFWWSVKSGQYDDLDGPAYRLLFDDEDARKDSLPLPLETALPETPLVPPASSGKGPQSDTL